MIILPPPKITELPAGTKFRAGLSESTAIADFDFETYSPAGFSWNEEKQKWRPLSGANKKGLQVTGAAAYTEHPDAEVLSLAYDLKNGCGPRLWKPISKYSPQQYRTLHGLHPYDLFEHLKNGNLIEAWNVSFECWVWENICVPKYGFPPLPHSQVRCAMAKARAFALPGKLSEAGKILTVENTKDKNGERLLKKFSIPRDPTKTNFQKRMRPEDDAEGFALYKYNLQDIVAEAEISSRTPDLSDDELEFWQNDQTINRRGVQVDVTAIDACISVINQAYEKYNAELRILTGGAVNAASEIAKIRAWAKTQGVTFATLRAKDVEEFLKKEKIDEIKNPKVRRALEIRAALGSASVKKLFAMKNQMSSKGRLHDLFIYHAARTGRTAGAGPQPQNLPKSGPNPWQCSSCKRWGEALAMQNCAYCDSGQSPWNNYSEWNFKAVEQALTTISTRSLECVEYYWSDAVATISGCLRGLFISAPGHDLICSDYSAIEAVVLAALAGEQWRLDVFNTHGKIYEMSASKITGIPFEEFELHLATSGTHHPMRGKIGKVAELAGGYQGGVSAWKLFGADKFFNSDEEINAAVKAWRVASPAIVAMWGGQKKNWKKNYHGLEGMAISAVLEPGVEFEYRNMVYLMRGDVLYSWHRLFPGSNLTYHRPRVTPANEDWKGLQLSFEGWNTNPKMGKPGWIRMETYGGKLAENWTQKIARFILANAIRNLERAGYPVVLHIHDEIVCEIPENVGSIKDFERIMSLMPPGAHDWPIFAKGGWRGKRYRKD